jgi:hypothetical protein
MKCYDALRCQPFLETVNKLQRRMQAPFHQTEDFDFDVDENIDEIINQRKEKLAFDEELSKYYFFSFNELTKFKKLGV